MSAVPKATSRLLAILILGLGLVACTVPIDEDQSFPNENTSDQDRPIERYENMGRGGETLFGDISIGGEDGRAQGENFSTVNYYLWRATLETLSLGPLDSADPFGGVIITDWFNLEEEPGSQYRVTAYILGRELRTDNIKVALYVKRREADREVTERGSTAAETKLEDVILAKARDIRAVEFR